MMKLNEMNEGINKRGLIHGWALGRSSGELGRGSSELGRSSGELGRCSNELGRGSKGRFHTKSKRGTDRQTDRSTDDL